MSDIPRQPAGLENQRQSEKHRRRWVIKDTELAVLWPPFGRRSLPAPFMMTSCGIRPYLGERVRMELRQEMGDSLDRLSAALWLPDVRVAVNGWDIQDPIDPAGRLRALGVRRGPWSFLLRQLPGRTVHHSGPVEIVEQSELALARTVVETMPKVPTGTMGPVWMDRSRPLQWARAQRFLDAPRKRVGTIQVTTGKDSVTHTLSWQDLVDDGRYVVAPATPAVASGLSAEALTRTLHDTLSAAAGRIREL
ncbi:MAG: hypothetical protein HOQ24_01980 [Mycobacteriaceae bacterium]|nr:hypothetical protein [Mycobacteriaceae bacterium]